MMTVVNVRRAEAVMLGGRDLVSFGLGAVMERPGSGFSQKISNTSVVAGASIGIRWTVGDVSERGFETLALSVRGAWRIFGPEAAYAICVNTLPVDVARERTGKIPDAVAWCASDRKIPALLRDHLDAGMAEGVAWKLAPLRLFPDRYELSLDNDCILWAMPEAIRQWLSRPNDGTCVLAEDAAAAFGQFTPLCSPAPCNTGLRGLPPGFALDCALRDALATYPVRLVSELDEQGLQVAALSRVRPPLMATLDELAINSPFPPHAQRLGTCGVHFVGINMRQERPFYQRSALDQIAGNWERFKRVVESAVALAPRRSDAPMGIAPTDGVRSCANQSTEWSPGWTA